VPLGEVTGAHPFAGHCIAVAEREQFEAWGYSPQASGEIVRLSRVEPNASLDDSLA